MPTKKKRNFCDINPFCYAVSMKKNILKRKATDLFGKDKFAKGKSAEKLPNVVSEHSSVIIKKGKGIDITLQENKAVNIKIASAEINGTVIHPGEVFSFWRTVGDATKRKGYKDGRVITKDGIKPGMGGGLCNLGNTVNLLVLHSPLEIVELHKHSDALAPDEGKRVPFSAGTSICYNYIDYRFRNNTDQDVQLLVWCENGRLCGELRSRTEFPYSYELVEEDHHFRKEGDSYYRVSKIYRQVTEKATGNIIAKELIWDNHSLVMFDPELIPGELLRE
ncbi:MAG: VanW family protein [Firmicutes bacterium]|nr:VanW family protein [Bacillota bacterium]